MPMVRLPRLGPRAVLAFVMGIAAIFDLTGVTVYRTMREVLPPPAPPAEDSDPFRAALQTILSSHHDATVAAGREPGAVLSDAVSPNAEMPGTVSPNAVSPNAVLADAGSAGGVPAGTVSADAVSTGTVSGDAVSPGIVSADSVSPGIVSPDRPESPERTAWPVAPAARQHRSTL